MGVERSVTRWYLRRQLILAEIAKLEAQLSSDAQARAESASGSGADADVLNEARVSEQNTRGTELQLAMARERLKGLGYCPRPMMG